MTVRELNRDQLTELKQNYLTQKLDEQGEGISYGELAFVDDYVSDEEIFQEYSDTQFTNDDFFSSAGETYYRLNLNDCIGSISDLANALRDIANKIEDGYYRGEQGVISWSIEEID